MKRFIFICAAMILLFAANSSGTSYYQSDQLQTFTVQQTHNPTSSEIMQAEQTSDQFQPVVVLIRLRNEVIASPLIQPPVYCNPDYGLCSLNSYNLLTSGSLNKIYKAFRPVELVMRN